MSANHRGHGGRPRIHWDEAMLTALIRLRTRPHPASMPACAKRIGVAVSVIRKKCRELGLAQHCHPGPAPGSCRNPRDALGRFVAVQVIQQRPEPEAPVAASEALQ